MEPPKELPFNLQTEFLKEHKEVQLQNGETVIFESFKVDSMHLFHGSRVHGIQELTEADETTIGNGVYLTSNKEAAYGYGVVRSSKQDDQPTLYVVELTDLNILNLSTWDGIKSFAKKFKEVLSQRKDQIKVDHNKIMDKNTAEFIKYSTVKNIEERIGMIDYDSYRSLKDLLFGLGDWARSMLQDMGYDGLMAIEGGEVGNGVDIGKHDSYVIFDPKQVKVVEQQQFASII
ncbi:MAG: hypothetical protein AAB512_00480 [Patescibacteria group bacterium]